MTSIWKTSRSKPPPVTASKSRKTPRFSGAAGYVAQDRGSDYTYGVVTAGFGYAINEAASVSLYGSYSVASENYVFNDGELDVSNRELWWGVSVSAGF